MLHAYLASRHRAHLTSVLNTYLASVLRAHFATVFRAHLASGLHALLASGLRAHLTSGLRSLLASGLRAHLTSGLHALLTSGLCAISPAASSSTSSISVEIGFVKTRPEFHPETRGESCGDHIQGKFTEELGEPPSKMDNPNPEKL
ncbi:hypothetical protein ACLB2K_077466 [Fragaria x ananassa]